VVGKGEELMMRRRLVGDEQGQGLVEYALIIALVSLASVVALGFLSGKINDVFFKSGNVLNSVDVVAAPGGTGGTGGVEAPSGGSASIACTGFGCGDGLDDGETIRATTSGWSGSPTSYTYQWQRSGTAGSADCSTPRNFTDYGSPVTTASTTNDLTTQDTNNDYCYRVVVFATNGGGDSATVTSGELEAN
jgi:pilus assembly protein Flp/PilA